MNTWRPEGWNNSYRNAFELQGRVDTELEYYGKCFEDGADAILEALRKGGYETSQGDGMRLLFGTDAFIPDDPQPSEKPAEPQLYICSAGYPNCAFCDIKEPHPHNKGCDIDCLNGKTCVPYVPEKCVDVTYEHLREKLGKYKYGLR